VGVAVGVGGMVAVGEAAGVGVEKICTVTGLLQLINNNARMIMLLALRNLILLFVDEEVVSVSNKGKFLFFIKALYWKIEDVSML
jgi:hypothetical protein